MKINEIIITERPSSMYNLQKGTVFDPARNRKDASKADKMLHHSNMKYNRPAGSGSSSIGTKVVGNKSLTRYNPTGGMQRSMG